MVPNHSAAEVSVEAAGKSKPSDIPPLDECVAEADLHELTQFKDFEDLELYEAAAGFVSYRPITMLVRRVPFRVIIILTGLYFAVYTMWYALGFQSVEDEVGLEELPVDLTPFAVVAFAAPAIMCCASLFIAMRGQARWAAVVYGGSFAVNGIASAGLWAVLPILSGKYLLGVYTLVIVLIELDMAFVFFFKEHWLWPVGVMDCLLALCAGGVLLFAYGHRPAIFVLAAAGIGSAMVLFFVGWRTWSLWKARWDTLPDQEKYDNLWKDVERTHHAELVRLAENVNSLPHERAVQPFNTVEELFRRGLCLVGWFDKVVSAWARDCGAPSVRVHIAPGKSLRRTLEKVNRSYNGRICMVLDVVRSTLAVDNIDEVLVVLEYVERRCLCRAVKNRFDPAYNSRLTAGYRDVNIHLQFQELVGTEFEGFIFELQIHYAPILALKDSEGHKRYIRLRNLRGD